MEGNSGRRRRKRGWKLDSDDAPRHTTDTWTHLMTLAPSLAHGRGVSLPRRASSRPRAGQANRVAGRFTALKRKTT